MSEVTVVGSVFEGPGQKGDFGWMIEQPEYAHAFFIFNDNQTQYEAHRNAPDDTDGPGCSPGAGNGAIRPWQCVDPPRAGGIPTGDYGIEGGPGYPALTEDVKAIVDEAVEAIRETVARHGYTEVYYSSDGAGGLGSGTFNPAEEVKAYIVERIKTLEI